MIFLALSFLLRMSKSSSCSACFSNWWSYRGLLLATLSGTLSDLSSPMRVSFITIGLGPAYPNVVEEAFFLEEKIFFGRWERLMVASTLHRDSFDCRILLRAPLVGAISRKGKRCVVSQKSIYEFVGCGSIVKRLLLGLSTFTTLWATSRMRQRSEYLEFAWTRPFFLLISVLFVP